MRSFLCTVEAKRWLLVTALAAFMSLPLAVSAMVDGPNSVALVDSTSSHSGAAASTSVATPGDRSANTPTEQVVKPASKSPVSGLEPGTIGLMGFGLLALFLARRNAR